jgi:hypothetical protein
MPDMHLQMTRARLLRLAAEMLSGRLQQNDSLNT